MSPGQQLWSVGQSAIAPNAVVFTNALQAVEMVSATVVA